MGKKLSGNVYVDDVLYVKGAEPPKEVAARITNPKLWGGDVAEADDSDKGYADQKVPELKALIAERNEGREEGDLISSDGKKDDLVAALEADDAAEAEADDSDDSDDE